MMRVPDNKIQKKLKFVSLIISKNWFFQQCATHIFSVRHSSIYVKYLCSVFKSICKNIIWSILCAYKCFSSNSPDVCHSAAAAPSVVISTLSLTSSYIKGALDNALSPQKPQLFHCASHIEIHQNHISTAVICVYTQNAHGK